jgi:hypothetical protein
LKNDSEGISHEENTWRYIGGIFGLYFWKELEGDYWGNIWLVFLERIWGGSLGKYLGSISGKNLRGITGEIFVGYFEEDFGDNIDHYILFVDINSQTNILKWNLKLILNLERVWENFKIWIFGMLQIYPT